jgi:hypothetical protein
MLTTATGVALLATLVSAFRNKGQWDEYHRGHLTRGQMTNKVFTTVVLGGATVALFVADRVF